MKKAIVVILLGILCFPALGQNERILRLDPNNAEGGNFSDFFERIKFIPLETLNASSFNNVDQLEVTRDFFIILDKETNSILIFKRNGKFHSKISATKLGYSKMRPIYAFTYNNLEQTIHIPNPKLRYSTVRFDLNGKQLSSTKELLQSTDNLFFFSDRSVVSFKYAADPRMKDSTVYETVLTKAGKIQNKLFPYNQTRSSLISRDILYAAQSFLYPQGNDSTILFVRPYEYDIYSLNPRDGATKRFNFVFPGQNSLPKEFKTDSIFKGKRIAYLKSNPKIIFGLSHVYIFKQLLFVRLKSFGSEATYSLIYDLASDRFYDVSKISPDVGSTFFSISDNSIGGVSFDNFNFGASDGENLFTFYSSRKFLDQVTANKEKLKNIPEEINSLLKSISVDNNPLIIELKPKSK